MATLVIRPSAYSGQYNYGGGTWYNSNLSGNPSASNIDESTLDTADYNTYSDTTSNAGYAHSWYTFADPPSTAGIIDSISITGVCYYMFGTTGTVAAGSLIRMAGVNYPVESAHDMTSGTTHTFTDTWTTNPNTDEAWSWGNLEDILAGWTIYGTPVSVKEGYACQAILYQLYITVNYTPPPAAPTNVSATDNLSDKVTITWTKSSGATNYAVLREGEECSGTLGNVATYDDTVADPPVITAGTASASKGDFSNKIVLSLSGESIADGTSYSYTVKAYNAAGWSSPSIANSGYRKAASLSYQWQVSAGDSDASYSDITGATSSTHTFYDAPAGVGRYYRCKITATGSTTQYSTAERGFRAFISPIVII